MAVLPLPSLFPGSLQGPVLPAARRPRRVAGAAVLAAVLLAHLWAAGLWRLPARPLPGQRTAMQVVRIETVARVAPMPPSPPAAVPPAADQPPAVAAAPVPAPLPDSSSTRPALASERRAVTLSPAPAPLMPAPQATKPEAPAGPEPPATAAAETSADEGDAEAMSLPAGAAPPPLYATQLPAPAQLLYSLQRGALSGRASLSWQQDGQRYTLQFDAHANARRGPPLIEQRSSGQLDGNGLAPDRYTDRRRGRAMHAANFQRETGRISFSGPRVDYPAWAGAQDRLGTLVQLAGIYSAAPQPPAEVTLFVVGARGGAGLWTFKLLGTEQVATPLGEISTLYLRREPERREDLRVEVWLDPARNHWPVRIRSTPIRGGDPLELTLAAEPTKP